MGINLKTKDIDFEQVREIALRTAKGVMGARHPELEDAVQDACLRVFRHAAKFRGKSKFATWVTTIARNESLTRLCRVKPTCQLDSSDYLEQPEITQPDERIHDVKFAIQRLPEQQRRSMEGFLEGKSAEEIGKELGLNKSAVFKYQSVARERLKKQFAGE